MPQPMTVETHALVRELRGPVTLFPAGKFNVNGAWQNTGGHHPNRKTEKKGKNPQKGACPKSKPDPKWDGQPTKKGPLAFPPGRYSLQVKQKKAQRKYTCKIRPTQTKKESPPKEQGHPSSEETSCFEPNLQI